MTQDKSTALLYKKYLDEFGMVTSEVLISGPETARGTRRSTRDQSRRHPAFWKKMMTRTAARSKYNRNVINGLQARRRARNHRRRGQAADRVRRPRNTVLYLTRKLKDHTLLQAIARVNRLCEGKEFGYIIDYRGVLAERTGRLDLYRSCRNSANEDLAGTLADVSEEIASCRTSTSQLWDLFDR